MASVGMSINLSRHCGNRMCRRGRPRGADQRPELHAKGLDGQEVYLGPCGCPCSQCIDAEMSDEERLG